MGRLMPQILTRLALPWSLAATAGVLAATASTMVSVALLSVVMFLLTGAATRMTIAFFGGYRHAGVPSFRGGDAAA